MKILIAEDNVASRELLTEMLELWGHTVIECANGEEALAQLNSAGGVDLALLDIQMPVMDGMTTVRKIRDSRRSDLRVVALTAFAMAGDRDRFLQAGFQDYLAKPVDFAQLKALIDGISVVTAKRPFSPTAALSTGMRD